MSDLAEDLTIPAVGIPRSRRAWRDARFITGLSILVGIYVVGSLAPLFVNPASANAGASDVNLVPAFINAANYPGTQAAQSGHFLGTDTGGRDIFTSLLVAAPRTLNGALVGALLAVIVGVSLGLVAGYVRGRVDEFISALADIMLSIPALAVLIVVASFIGGLDPLTIGLLVAAFAWPMSVRVVRAQVLVTREQGWVGMARLSGASTSDIIFREIGPNLLPFIAAVFTSTMSLVLLIQSGIEVLGLGSSRVPTLGTMIYQAQQSSAIFRGTWWWWAPPVFVLTILFVALYLTLTGADRIANPRLEAKP